MDKRTEGGVRQVNSSKDPPVKDISKTYQKQVKDIPKLEPIERQLLAAKASCEELTFKKNRSIEETDVLERTMQRTESIRQSFDRLNVEKA